MEVRKTDRETFPLEHGGAQTDLTVLHDEMIDLDFFLSWIPFLRLRLTGSFRSNRLAERRHVLLDLADVAAGRAALIRDLGPSIKISSMMSLSDRAVFRSTLTLASASLNARSAWKPGGLPTTSPLSRPCPEKGERSTASTITVVPVILGPTASTPALIIELK